MRTRALLKFTALAITALAAVAPGASAQALTAASTGGFGVTPTNPMIQPTPVIPGLKAKVIKSGPQKGLASPPQLAPPEVQNAIWAANQIIGKPYEYGGGHKNFRLASGYDCSSSVSFALNGAQANLLDTPLDSSSFMKWGEKGKGTWFTVYTNPGHAFLIAAGLRLDTSAVNDPGGKKGPRWRPKTRSTKGFTVRHPLGF